MMKHFCLLLFLVLLAFASGAGQEQGCFTMAAGKAATADGAVLVGHNEDDRGPFIVNAFKIGSQELPKGDGLLSGKGRLSPLLQHTIAFFWLNVPGTDFADSLFNERGVIITSDACASREDRSELAGAGIAGQLRRLVAERARSAREGVRIAGELIHAYGYAFSGRAYIIADSGEAWILHAVRGRHWIARRVPDDQVAVIANCYTIGEVNLADSANFLGSPDLVEYAERRGWYHAQKDGAFDFAKAYSDPGEYRAMANLMRQWRGTSLLADEEYGLEDPLPFSFKPRHKIRIQDFFRVLRDHYEGTEYDLSERYKTGSPHATKNQTICGDATQYSFVAHLRGWLPPEMGNLVWIAFRRPDANAYSPWYFSISNTPSNYARGDSEAAGRSPAPSPTNESPDEAFWNFAKLSELVERQYRERSEKVQKVWRNFENYVFKDIKNREKEFEYILKNHRTVAIGLITNYVHFLEYRKWLLTADLIREFRK